MKYIQQLETVQMVERSLSREENILSDMLGVLSKWGEERTKREQESQQNLSLGKRKLIIYDEKKKGIKEFQKQKHNFKDRPAKSYAALIKEVKLSRDDIVIETIITFRLLRSPKIKHFVLMKSTAV